jgi:threonine dehydrogenase-like Zn-dependent dehydrogenase
MDAHSRKTHNITPSGLLGPSDKEVDGAEDIPVCGERLLFAGGREIDRAGPAIAGYCGSLDQAASFDPVDKPGHRGLLDTEDACQFAHHLRPVSQRAWQPGLSGVDVVVESIGRDATYGQAIEVVRKRGKVMFFGAVQDTVTLPLLPILHEEVTMIGCTGANDETPQAVRLIAEAAIDVSSLITHSFPLDEAGRAFAVMNDPSEHAVKVHLEPQSVGA